MYVAQTDLLRLTSTRTHTTHFTRTHETGTVGWGCLILFGAPDDGADAIRLVIVMVGLVIALLTMVFYLFTACTDPGIVFRHLAATPPLGVVEQQRQQQDQHRRPQQQWGSYGGFGGIRGAEMVRRRLLGFLCPARLLFGYTIVFFSRSQQLSPPTPTL